MIYRFGEFALDAATLELRKGDAPVAIEPQVFSLLLHLIENRHQVMSKDDLIDAVWDGRAVSDTTLNSRIFALRRAVGDDGRAQTVIRTLPRRGFRFVADLHGVDAFAPPAIAQAPTRHPTLVVLPFKAASSGLDDYFCDGLTEDIIANLTHFRELRVIAGGTSLRFKDRALSMADIARETKADYIVDGSVRRDRDRLRVAVQLVAATDGVSLWADRYDRQMAEIFAVQDAVTHMIVAALGVKIQGAALTLALRKSPSELDAYDCLLHARRYTSTLNEKMHADARDLLEKAIALDPNYAEAYALLANVYLAEHRFDANPRPDPIGRALKMALKATQLDPQSAYAHCWLAIVHFFQKDNVKFEAEARRALDLNPNDPEILAEIGHYLSFLGEFDRGIALSRRAQDLNPLHPGWFHFSFALFHISQGRYADVLIDMQRVSMPNFFWTHLLIAAALGQMGDPGAGAALARMHQAKPGVSAADELRKWNVAPPVLARIMQGLRNAGHDE